MDLKSPKSSAQEVGDVAVSSTKIRSALAEGAIKVANQFLGYNFMLNGTVVKGKGLGKTIQFPTANLKIEEPINSFPKKESISCNRSLMPNWSMECSTLEPIPLSVMPMNYL